MEPIKIDLNGSFWIDVAHCPVCRGTKQNPEQPEGEVCSFCQGTGAVQQKVKISELFEAFRQMLRHEGM